MTDTTAPFGTLTAGASTGGRIEAGGDADLFALAVTAGQTYTINLNAATSGGLADPVLRLLNGNGGQIAVNDDFGGGRNSQITYTATTTGTVYLEAKGYQSGTGNYTLSARSSAPPAPTDDFRDSLADTTAPLGTLNVGAAASGRIETGGDTDLFAISLVAGQSYTFGLTPGAGGRLADPALRLLNGAGTQLAANNDFGGTLNSQISFTASTSGTYYLEADGASATGTGTYSLSAANVTAPPPPTAGAFDIQIRYTGDAAYQSLFDQAAARWEEVITADLPNFTSSRFGTIDDLLIDASVTSIDGSGGTLGQAGPDELRPASAGGLPTHGIMQFDSADVAALAGNGSLLGVILHEMGHVLGLGTLWERAGLTAGTNQYDGAAALAEYRVLTGGNETFIPLENDGGPGTAGGHWEEDIFRSELMTGFASGGLEMSRMTIASLQDLGYGVNLAEADPYALPGRSNTLALVQDDPIWGVM
ncbi:pre-peptidase C-terminal domain-containing protein [Methylobacterium iners]|uniref:pre-peptidase C-terminal domain-containing protein n=1 Tax=Methylobacterium iners TaxID=418707 RepID=UPI002795A9E7|nr:pre-peptidase C-terminal domain-containing protein [Methylobacterium iners]